MTPMHAIARLALGTTLVLTCANCVSHIAPYTPKKRRYVPTVAALAEPIQAIPGRIFRAEHNLTSCNAVSTPINPGVYASLENEPRQFDRPRPVLDPRARPSIVVCVPHLLTFPNSGLVWQLCPAEFEIRPEPMR